MGRIIKIAIVLLILYQTAVAQHGVFIKIEQRHEWWLFDFEVQNRSLSVKIDSVVLESNYEFDFMASGQYFQVRQNLGEEDHDSLRANLVTLVFTNFFPNNRDTTSWNDLDGAGNIWINASVFFEDDVVFSDSMRCVELENGFKRFAMLKEKVADSATVALKWDANTEEDLAGYRVYCGYDPGDYIHFHDVGLDTTDTISNDKTLRV